MNTALTYNDGMMLPVWNLNQFVQIIGALLVAMTNGFYAWIMLENLFIKPVPGAIQTFLLRVLHFYLAFSTYFSMFVIYNSNFHLKVRLLFFVYIFQLSLFCCVLKCSGDPVLHHI